jgi:hypothetical protein
MKIGGENKKAVWALAVLGVFAAYGVYSNFSSGPPAAPASAVKTQAVDAIPSDAIAVPEARSASPKPAARAVVQEFRPVLRPKKKEDQIIDIRTVDPTIRLDLLAKVQAVPQAGAERDLFQILKSPPVHADTAQLKGEEPHVWRIYGPQPPPPPPMPAPDPSTLPPPPIPLKYYGICTERLNGKKTAYFLDNDEIIEATEGMTLKGRYKVVRIGEKAVVMEDMQSKRQQDLPLVPELAG